MYSNKYINFIFLIITIILLFFRKNNSVNINFNNNFNTHINRTISNSIPSKFIKYGKIINNNPYIIITLYLIILNFIQFLLHLDIENNNNINIKINNLFDNTKDCSFNNKFLTFINQGLYLFQPYILLLIFQLFESNLHKKNIYDYLKIVVLILCIFNSILFYFKHYNCSVDTDYNINCNSLCTLNKDNDLKESIKTNSANYNYITFINIFIIIIPLLFIMNYKVTLFYSMFITIMYFLNYKFKFIYKGENGIFISGISLFFIIVLLLNKYLYTK